MSPIEFTISVQLCKRENHGCQRQHNARTVQSVDQSWILPKTCVFRPFLLMLDFNGKMKALNGGNPFMKSTEKDRKRGAATLGEWKRRRTEILSNPPLTITSLLCIEDAFETYLPASMNPSENVISKARKKTGFLSRTVCRFHKSVNCLSESSQIQTETWLLFFFLETCVWSDF